jgi:hypothetical protein
MFRSLNYSVPVQCFGDQASVRYNLLMARSVYTVYGCQAYSMYDLLMARPVSMYNVMVTRPLYNLLMTRLLHSVLMARPLYLQTNTG